MERNKLEFNYTVKKEEYYRFNKTNNKKIDLICQTVLWNFFVYDTCKILVGQGNLNILTLLSVGFIWGLILKLLEMLFSIPMYIYCISIYKKSKELQNEVCLTINQEKINEKTKFTETNLLIEDIYKIKRDKKAYYIFLDKSRAFIIPKRLMNENEEKLFLEIIKSKL